MAHVTNVQLGTSATAITQGGATSRNILSLRLVNTSTTDIVTFSLYLYPSGGSASTTTIIKYDKALDPKEDYWFTKDELFRLDNGEVLAGLASIAATVTVTVNYTDR